jgi:lysyl-tRNA synthetase class 2
MTPATDQPGDDRRRGSAGRGARWRRGYLTRAPQALSRIATLIGLVALADALWPRHWGLLSALDPVLPSSARIAVEALTVVSAVLLLRVAAGLRKRKRAAWRIAVAACATIAAAELIRDAQRPVEAAAAIALFVALLAARSRFTAQADPRGRWSAARVGAQLIIGGAIYGMVLLYLPNHVASGTSFWARLREVLASFAGFGGALRVTNDPYSDTLHATLLGLGLLTLTCVLVVLLRCDQPVAVLSVEDEGRLRTLLDRHGARDSLGYFALRRDKSVVWSASGKAALTYRVVCGVALVSGDPIGDPEAWPGAIEAYQQLVERNGWTPAVTGCSELAAVVFGREYGLSALQLGDEAVLSVSGFALQGRAMRGVRQACTRVGRAGYDVRIRRVHELGSAELDQLRAAADTWRVDAVERGYSMALSRLGDPHDRECLVVTAQQDGALRGLLYFVPWGTSGISLDLMRRDRDSDNGLNEFMIAAVMQAGPQLGIEQVSLNFAVFRDALERGSRVGAGPVLRLWRRVLLVASRWWQIDSLYRFNSKFQPEWRTRFVCFPSARDVPRVAIAALEAEAFLVRPRVLRRLLGRG